VVKDNAMFGIQKKSRASAHFDEKQNDFEKKF